MKKVAVILVTLLTIFSLLSCSAQTSTQSLQTQTPAPALTSTPAPTVANGVAVTDFDITLKLAFGSRAGKYTGTLVNGMPTGQGKFVTRNNYGTTWTYLGDFANGHFQGKGLTTWSFGISEQGTYENDYLVSGEKYDTGKLFYKGSFAKEVYNGKGALYDLAGNVIFEGTFENGYRTETQAEQDSRAASLATKVLAFTDDDYKNCMINEAPYVGKLVEIKGKVKSVVKQTALFAADGELTVYLNGNKKETINVVYQYAAKERKPKAGNTIRIYGVVYGMYNYVQNRTDKKMPAICAYVILYN